MTLISFFIFIHFKSFQKSHLFYSFYVTKDSWRCTFKVFNIFLSKLILHNEKKQTRFSKQVNT